MAATRDALIRRRLANEMGQRMRWTHPLTLVPLVVMATVLFGSVPLSFLIIWLAAMVLVEASLIVLTSPRVMRLWQSSITEWLYFYGAGHLLATTGWMLAGAAFFQPLQEGKALLLTMTVFAICVGGLNALSWSFRLYMAGNVLLLVPLGFWLLLAYHSTTMEILGGLCLVFLPMINVASWREFLAHRQFIESELDRSRLQASLVDQGERLSEVQQAFSELKDTDRLTQLPSLHIWKRVLGLTLDNHRRALPLVAVFFIDVRGFRKINQRWGQAEGDTVIADMGQRLLAFADRSRISHLSADEFVLFREFEDEQQVRDFAGKIIESLSRRLTLEERYVTLSPVIGASLCPVHTRSPDLLVEYASLANYYCKRESGDEFCIYDSSLADRITRKIDIELALKDAIENDEFHLAYQPQVNLETGEMIGVEALLRWRSKTLGDVAPGEFVPVAEQTGLILAVGEWVIRRACEDLAEWRLQFPRGFHIAINVSAVQLASEDVLVQLQRGVKENALDAGNLHVEITESAIMKNAAKAISVIRAIRRMGISVALDDFGTGFSSLGYLRTLDIDYLKLDQSFIRSITDREKDREITKAVISMAKALGLRVVAEGVESETVRNTLGSQGCDFGQGWLFGKPQARADYGDLVNV